MKNISTILDQRRRAKYQKLRKRFLQNLKTGDFGQKSTRNKYQWVEKLKKLEKQLGLASNLKLQHWALAFALGFVTVAGHAQSKQEHKSKLHPNRVQDKTILQNKTRGGNHRTQAVSIFSEQPILGDGLVSEEQYVGDFDSDGDEDVLVFGSYNPIKLFLNDGNGDISTQREVWSSAYEADDILIGDIDGDSNLDIVLTVQNQSNQTQFHYLINDGSGNFSDTSSSFGSRNDLKQLSDIDNDGDLDIIAQIDTGGYVYELKILTNDGTGSFTTSANDLSFLPNTNNVFAGKFTSDVFPDLVVMNVDTVKVYINDGAGGFTNGSQVSTLLTNTNYNYVELGAQGDTDADGDDDLVVNVSEVLFHLENDGTGAFAQTTVKENLDATLSVYYNDVKLSNLDANAGLEIIVNEEVYDTTLMTSTSGNIFFTNDGSNAFAESAQSLVLSSGNTDPSYFPIDFDGDGDTDILLSSYVEMELLENDGTSNITSFDDQIVDVTYGPDFDLIDLDGDTDLDIIISYNNKTLLNDGSGNFTIGQELPSTRPYYYLATGDFDNDSDGDVVFSNEILENEFTLWKNDGAGSLTVDNDFVSSIANGSIQAIESGDMDGDGNLDVVTIVSADGGDNISIWTNDGSGSFTESNLAATNRVRGLILADVDTDGDLDVIVKAEDYYGDALGLSVYTNNAGNLSFKEILTPLGASFHIPEVGFAANDVDEDGDEDILVVNAYSSPVEINLLTNDGGGNFTASVIGSAGYAYAKPVLEDFDLDGDTDLFLAGGESYDEFWENDGAENFSLVGNLDSRSYGVVAGDIDGDGDKDLFTLEYYQGNKFIINNTNGLTSLSGFVTLDGTDPLTNGEVTLLRITDTEGYDTTSVVSVGIDGGFTHTDVLTGQYLMLAQGDSVDFSGYLPTYWGVEISSYLWEEADTIQLDSAIIDLEIILEGVPQESTTGTGSIGGILEEEVPDGGRVEGKKRVGGAGVSVRRRNRQGRDEEDELILAGYAYTNDEGEFKFEKLDEDTYFLNIQYPGYPMDSTSFVEIPIGSGSKGAVEVEALVVDGKIVVTQIEVTELFEREDVKFSIYPNPTNERLFLNANLENTEPLRLVFYNEAGERVINMKSDVNNMHHHGIDITKLSQGSYIMQVVNKEGELLKTARIVVTKE